MVKKRLLVKYINEMNEKCCLNIDYLENYFCQLEEAYRPFIQEGKAIIAKITEYDGLYFPIRAETKTELHSLYWKSIQGLFKKKEINTGNIVESYQRKKQDIENESESIQEYKEKLQEQIEELQNQIDSCVNKIERKEQASSFFEAGQIPN